MSTAVVHKHRRARLVLDPGKTHISAMLAVHGRRYSIPMCSYQSIPVDPVYEHESCMVLGDRSWTSMSANKHTGIYLSDIYIYGLVEIKADEGDFFFTYRLVGKGRFDIADALEIIQ